MCTVSWINGVVTSMRDDVPSKGGLTNMKRQGNDFVILLNGGLNPSKHDENHNAISRVQVINNILDDPNMDFSGFKPFTLVIYKDEMLTELVWDANQKYVRYLDQDSTHLWRSCTLYDSEEQWRSYIKLMEFTLGEDRTPLEIEEFHKKHFTYPGNDRGTITLSTVQFLRG